MGSDTVVFMYHWDGVDEKVFDHHFQALTKSNPALDIVRFSHKDTQDPRWNKIKYNRKLAYSNCDLVIYDFYRQHPNYKRYMYLEWDTYCTMDLHKILDPAMPFHLTSYRSFHPGYDEPINPWLTSRSKALPPEMRKLAMLATSLNGISCSNELLSQISKPHLLHTLNIWCEMRIAVLARLHGFEPAHYPLCPRSMDGFPGVKGQLIVGEGLWHPVKRRTLTAYTPPSNCPAIGLWLGSHPNWIAVISLQANGRILQNGRDAGRWVYFDDGELTLMWDNYAPERLKRTDDGFAEGGFSLAHLDSATSPITVTEEKLITYGPLLPDTAFKAIVDKLSVRKSWYFYQAHGNLGDQLIARGTHRFFRELGLNVILNPLPERWDPTEVGIIFSGGGNLGIYENVVAAREQVLNKVRGSSTPVVVLPQSGVKKLAFSDVTTLFAREAATKALYPDSILAPDMALFATIGAPEVTPHRKFGIFLRNDVEGVISTKRGRDPYDMFGTPEEAARAILQHQTIVTDRLHFAILAMMLKRETFLLPNSYHKNKSMYETWLKDLGCKWADDAFEWTGERVFKRPAKPDKPVTK